MNDQDTQVQDAMLEAAMTGLADILADLGISDDDE